MKPIVVIGVCAALCAGCSDVTPTEATKPPVEASERPDLADALSVIDDALNRIVPTLTDRTAAQSVEGALRALRTGLANTDPASMHVLVEAAQAAVDGYTDVEIDQADLDSIRLALDYTASELTAQATD
jgi:hypothetical protein